MVEEPEIKRPGPSAELLEKIRGLRNDRTRVHAEIAKLHDRLKELNIKLGAYEDAATMIFGENQYAALLAAIEGNIQARNLAAGGLLALGRELLQDATKQKNISENWAKLLVAMSEHPSFSYDDLLTMSEIMEWEISKATLRSQIKTYVDSELVERLENERGRFRVTPSGRTTAEASLRKVAPPPPPPPAPPALTIPLPPVPPVPPVPMPPTMTSLPQVEPPRDPWGDLEELIHQPLREPPALPTLEQTPLWPETTSEGWASIPAPPKKGAFE